MQGPGVCTMTVKEGAVHSPFVSDVCPPSLQLPGPSRGFHSQCLILKEAERKNQRAGLMGEARCTSLVLRRVRARIQGTQELSRSWRRQPNAPTHTTVQKEAQPCRPLDLTQGDLQRLQIFRTVRAWRPFGLGHQVRAICYGTNRKLTQGLIPNSHSDVTESAL